VLSRTVVRVSLLVDYEEPPNIAVQRDRGLALLAARPLRAPQRGPDRMCRSPGVLTYDWTKNGGQVTCGEVSTVRSVISAPFQTRLSARRRVTVRRTPPLTELPVKSHAPTAGYDPQTAPHVVLLFPPCGTLSSFVVMFQSYYYFSSSVPFFKITESFSHVA